MRNIQRMLSSGVIASLLLVTALSVNILENKDIATAIESNLYDIEAVYHDANTEQLLLDVNFDVGYGSYGIGDNEASKLGDDSSSYEVDYSDHPISNFYTNYYINNDDSPYEKEKFLARYKDYVKDGIVFGMSRDDVEKVLDERGVNPKPSVELDYYDYYIDSAWLTSDNMHIFFEDTESLDRAMSVFSLDVFEGTYLGLVVGESTHADADFLFKVKSTDSYYEDKHILNIEEVEDVKYTKSVYRNRNGVNIVVYYENDIVAVICACPTLPFFDNSDIEGYSIYGDINQNGTISSNDTLIMLSYISGRLTSSGHLKLSPTQLDVVDISRDGKVNVADAAQILLVAEGKTPSDSGYHSSTIQVGTKAIAAKEGDLIEIPVTISADSNCYAAEFEIDYDKNTLEFFAAHNEGIFEFDQIYDIEEGKLKLVFAGSEAVAAGGNIATLTFRVKSGKETGLVIKNDNMFGFNSKLETIGIPHEAVNGSFSSQPEGFSAISSVIEFINGLLRVKTDLTNDQDVSQVCRVILAIYDKAGKLTAIKTDTLTLASGEQQSFISELSGLRPDAGYSAKLFVWDGNFVPLVADYGVKLS